MAILYWYLPNALTEHRPGTGPLIQSPNKTGLTCVAAHQFWNANQSHLQPFFNGGKKDGQAGGHWRCCVQTTGGLHDQPIRDVSISLQDGFEQGHDVG